MFSVSVEISVLLLIFGVLGILILLGRNATTDFAPVEPISLDLSHLPEYALLSLGRCLAAFALSLAFTFIYGTIAASSRRAASVMVPALDILQSIPVLSFLPAIVLGLVAIVPGTRIGLELASILMIFTGQVWNLTFGYFGALRSVPRSFNEVADIGGYGPIQRFLRFRLPTTMGPLVYNSMLSFAGGWFFLAVCEAFTLSKQEYQLAGIGSYVALAVAGQDPRAIIGGLLAMGILVIGTDQLFFRPLVAWSDRFRMEATSSGKRPGSWLYDLLRRSRLVANVNRRALKRRASIVNIVRNRKQRSPSEYAKYLRRIVLWVCLLALAAIAALGLRELGLLLVQVPWNPDGIDADKGTIGWSEILVGFSLSFLRVLGALVLATLWAVPFGIWVAKNPRRFGAFSPIIQLAASYPAPLIFPVIAVWLTGIHVSLEIVVVLLLVFGAQWYVLFNVLAGGRSIPTPFDELSKLFGMGVFKRFRLVQLPVVLPTLTTGWITGAGAAWNATIVAEYIDLGPDHVPDQVLGIGSIIARASTMGAYPALAAATIVMALGVVIINRLAWNRIEHWARTRFELS